MFSNTVRTQLPLWVLLHNLAMLAFHADNKPPSLQLKGRTEILFLKYQGVLGWKRGRNYTVCLNYFPGEELQCAKHHGEQVLSLPHVASHGHLAETETWPWQAFNPGMGIRRWLAALPRNNHQHVHQHFSIRYRLGGVLRPTGQILPGVLQANVVQPVWKLSERASQHYCLYKTQPPIQKPLPLWTVAPEGFHTALDSKTTQHQSRKWKHT